MSRHISEQHKQRPLPVDVISIQSQVVYGCVGNSAAVPVLQQYGLTVATVPTVVFSNTPLYPTIHGGIIPDDWFSGYLTALSERQVLENARTILLGYLGSSAQAEILADWLESVRQNHPQISVQIDPVLGDIGSGLYVDPALAENYRQQLRHLATGLTPNHFELEYLTGRKIHTLDQSIAAAKSLLSDTTEWIIATSAAPDDCPVGQMQLVVVSHKGHDLQRHPYYHTDAQGTGDVFAAAFAANRLHGYSLTDAAERAANRVIAAVKATTAAQVNELCLIAPDTHA